MKYLQYISLFWEITRDLLERFEDWFWGKMKDHWILAFLVCLVVFLSNVPAAWSR